jgi:hypothetical protein
MGFPCSPRKIQTRAYAVGAMSLRQSDTLLFKCVQFFRATRGKTAHKRKAKYLLSPLPGISNIIGSSKMQQPAALQFDQLTYVQVVVR